MALMMVKRKSCICSTLGVSPSTRIRPRRRPVRCTVVSHVLILPLDSAALLGPRVQPAIPASCVNPSASSAKQATARCWLCSFARYILVTRWDITSLEDELAFILQISSSLKFCIAGIHSFRCCDRLLSLWKVVGSSSGLYQREPLWPESPGLFFSSLLAYFC